MQMTPSPPGMIRSFDVARDGEAVADLIEDAFALKNDPDGQFVLVQMRENARKFKEANWVPPPGTMLGFVWEVEGKLAGNISLIPHSHAGAKLHLIANVAVARVASPAVSGSFRRLSASCSARIEGVFATAARNSLRSETFFACSKA